MYRYIPCFDYEIKIIIDGIIIFIIPSAALNGSEEQLCNNRYDLAQGMLCLPDLQCDLCPEDEHLRAMFCLTPNHRNTAGR